MKKALLRKRNLAKDTDISKQLSPFTGNHMFHLLSGFLSAILIGKLFQNNVVPSLEVFW